MSVALVGLSTGATLTVQKDGSGGYTAIQPALDAAADGDTVFIGPGEFLEETSYRPPGWGYDMRAYGRVLSDNIVIIGAGAGQTIIGPTTYVDDSNYFNPKGFHYREGESVTVKNLTIRNCREGLRGLCTFYVEDCELVDNYVGVFWEPVDIGGWIIGTYIRGDDPSASAVDIFGTGSGIKIEDCEFDNATIVVENIQGFRVVGCVMRNSLVGMYIYGTAQVLIQDTEISDIGLLGVGFYFSGGYCEIRNSLVSAGNEALRTSTASRLLVENSILSGGARAVIYAKDNPGPCIINNCDLVKGTGPVVLCESSTVPVVHDLTDNYWGTDQESVVQRWIIDSNDDTSILATVSYSPFSPISVSVEKKSLGSFKAMFR